jgi:hypothetical protein
VVGATAVISLFLVFAVWLDPKLLPPFGGYSAWTYQGGPRLEDRDAATAASILLPIVLAWAVVAHLRNPAGSRMFLSLMREALFGRHARR